MQLQPIQAGAAFRAISERIGSAELAGVRRQREAWARDASQLFARGKVEDGLDAYAQHGRIIEAEHRAELIERIVAGENVARNLATLRELCDTMISASLCALGGMAPFPVLSALEHFPDDFLRASRDAA